ncbi:MAG: iron-sulfur cluster repair di-iron protein [Tannerella sp.]|jgi:regulator of cell morphogenesis and NO signaling|nr:iron-sulfur cluster repair di-iron protein [Tannerella sp.]
MENNLNLTVGEIVTKDFRMASVFSEYGIDFCCGGDKTLEQACAEKSVNREELQEKLDKIMQVKAEGVDFNSWSLDLLIDYIEKMHHTYIREKTPFVLQYLEKIRDVHGDRHPELVEIYGHFFQAAEALSAHLLKEERILFPFIRQLVEYQKSGQRMEPGHFGTVQNPIAMMKHEHTVEGERFETISRLSGGYQAPEDGCNTYRAAYAMLGDFEQDLHKHIHLENNILFPKAIELEKSLRAT